MKLKHQALTQLLIGEICIKFTYLFKILRLNFLSYICSLLCQIFSKTKRQKIKVRVYSDRIQRSPKEYTFIFNFKIEKVLTNTERTF